MTTVRILPEILSNQIAAGEVVQRPSSVVKELVENSIDAKATSISIEIEHGGKSLIRVSDDGIGLSRDDALLSIERYATSKIHATTDLFSIGTMGFRGEALPSIASVSKFCLQTRTKRSDTGTKIEMAGGKIFNVTDVGAPVGTMVEVKHLFFNTPARKKFLKSDATEVSHIGDTISGLALGNPHIRFRLFLNQRLQKNFSADHDLFQRAVTVLGKDVADQLFKIDFSTEFIRITGFLASPMVSRSSPSKIFIFVNNRLVHDRGVVAGIFNGYKGRLMKGRYPLAVVFIHIAFDQVDVNVHPSKREVKFFDSRQVVQAVASAVETTLSAAQSDPGLYSHLDVKRDPVFEFKENLTNKNTAEFSGVEQSVAEWPASDKKTAFTEPEEPRPQISSIPDLPGAEKNFFKIIGQVMNTYILAESRDGLILIDQHAAHERIVYEALMRRQRTLKGGSQTLAVAETMELSFREADILERFLSDFAGLGFHIEHFGGTTFVIKAIPSLIDEREAKPVILDIIEQALTDQNGFSKQGWLEDCLITMACHTAIRANNRMDTREMDDLLKKLYTCDNPLHCPHGRPTMVTFSKQDLEKLFKRIV